MGDDENMLDRSDRADYPVGDWKNDGWRSELSFVVDDGLGEHPSFDELAEAIERNTARARELASRT